MFLAIFIHKIVMFQKIVSSFNFLLYKTRTTMSMCSADVTNFFFSDVRDEPVQHSVSFFSEIFFVCNGIKEGSIFYW